MMLTDQEFEQAKMAAGSMAEPLDDLSGEVKAMAISLFLAGQTRVSAPDLLTGRQLLEAFRQAAELHLEGMFRSSKH